MTLRGRTALPGLLGAFAASGVAAQTPYRIGPSVRVSQADSLVEFQEAQIAADPRSAAHLVACAIAMPHDSLHNVFYASFDGGQTWSATLRVRPGVDPSCAIDGHGVAFAASIHDSALAGGDSFLAVHRSSDGGRTWEVSSVRVDTRSVDRSYITVEDGAGPTQERVYVHAYLSAPRDTSGKRLPRYPVLYTSSDGGRTFDRVVPIPWRTFADPTFFPGNGIITADGSFVALILELDNAGKNMSRGRSDSASAPQAANGVLRLLRSTDGGESIVFRRVADVFYDWRLTQLSMPSLAADRSGGPHRGRLYAAWPDAGSEWRTRIWFAWSDDKGRTWSAPQVASDDAGAIAGGQRANTFMPMVSVNKDGVVGLSWYDRRDSPNNLTYRPRFAASLDGGEHWLPSVAATNAVNELEPTDAHLNGGDTSGLAADADGVFHLAWIDNRTGVRQVWTTTIGVRR